MTINPQAEAVELTARTCRYCRRPYVVPKGHRWHACRDCAPTIEDELARIGNDTFDDLDEPRPDDGIPF